MMMRKGLFKTLALKLVRWFRKKFMARVDGNFRLVERTVPSKQTLNLDARSLVALTVSPRSLWNHLIVVDGAIEYPLVKGYPLDYINWEQDNLEIKPDLSGAPFLGNGHPMIGALILTYEGFREQNHVIDIEECCETHPVSQLVETISWKSGLNALELGGMFEMKGYTTVSVRAIGVIGEWGIIVREGSGSTLFSTLPAPVTEVSIDVRTIPTLQNPAYVEFLYDQTTIPLGDEGKRQFMVSLSNRG